MSFPEIALPKDQEKKWKKNMKLTDNMVGFKQKINRFYYKSTKLI